MMEHIESHFGEVNLDLQNNFSIYHSDDEETIRNLINLMED